MYLQRLPLLLIFPLSLLLLGIIIQPGQGLSTLNSWAVNPDFLRGFNDGKLYSESNSIVVKQEVVQAFQTIPNYQRGFKIGLFHGWKQAFEKRIKGPGAVGMMVQVILKAAVEKELKNADYRRGFVDGLLPDNVNPPAKSKYSISFLAAFSLASINRNRDYLKGYQAGRQERGVKGKYRG